MKVEWLRTVHVQFLFKSELLCYAKNVDSASFVSFRNNINVKLNLKMRVMRNKKKTLIISLVLLACFASSACAVSKGMKKVVDEALDFSVKQSMSMFSEMQGQVGILPRTAKDGKIVNRLGGQVVFIPVHCGIAMNIVMIRRLGLLQKK